MTDQPGEKGPPVNHLDAGYEHVEQTCHVLALRSQHASNCAECDWSSDPEPMLTPHKAFQIADYLCSALGPLVKASVQDDLIALKFHLWDAYQAAQSGRGPDV